MSTNWYVWCETCQVQLTERDNHADERMAMARDAAAEIAALQAKTRSWHYFEVSINGCRDVAEVGEHASHDLRVVSEYGDERERPDGRGPWSGFRGTLYDSNGEEVKPTDTSEVGDVN